MLRDYKTDGAIYSAFEFVGDKDESQISLSVDSRMVVSNMVQEMECPNVAYSHDKILEQWLSGLSNKPNYKPVVSDSDLLL